MLVSGSVYIRIYILLEKIDFKITAMYEWQRMEKIGVTLQARMVKLILDTFGSKMLPFKHQMNQIVRGFM